MPKRGPIPPSSNQAFLAEFSTAVVRRDTPARSSPTARANNPLQPAPFLLRTLSTAAIGIGAKALHGWFSNERLLAAAACKAKVSQNLRNEDALPYVLREQEDAELDALVDRPVKTIVFAIGPRGAGKTMAIVRALERIDGALLIKLTGAHDRDTSVYFSILDEVIGPRLTATPLREADIVSYLKAAAHRYRRQHANIRPRA
ncbi:hypothetical protein T492DRAFT_867209 [Pavlovales sp. CCMP2436]|nr:hypothetical protein T492DRAFT_867209 [Pavlovales sp. CCMP2436]